ncbi:MAG: hypothetical protein JWP09_286 [Candidatus Taylorbacteria bacterium]|nr:hypothetical protein [Candidatus Taylorbacteria bacterium]
MIKIPDIVKEILYSSEVALSAFYEGYLNLSSYAVSIKAEVESKTKKKVRLGTIVVALSRLKKGLRIPKKIIPDVKIEDLSIRQGLIEITFNKTPENISKLKLLNDKSDTHNKYILVSQGAGEISIITHVAMKDYILKVFKDSPKAIIDSLSSVTIRFGADYINTSNVIYKFVRELALKTVVIVEIISTYSELSFIVFDRDGAKVLEILGKNIVR